MFNFLDETTLMILSFVVLFLVFIAFVREKTPPFLVALTGMCVLLACGAMSTEDMLSVFSNSAAITIACMFIMSAALVQTGVVDVLGQSLLRLCTWNKYVGIGLTFAIIGLISSFMNNTPVVIILAPVFITLAQKLKDYPSKYLIPLSYVAIMGGACTLIGTSTNILVSSIAQQNGQNPIGMFEMTGPAFLMMLAGMTFMALFGRFLLPAYDLPSKEDENAEKKRFLAEATIPAGSPIVGKSINDIILTRAGEYEIIDLVRKEKGAVMNVKVPVIQSIFERFFSSQGNSEEQNIPTSTFRDIQLEAGDRLVFRLDKDAIIELQKHIGIDFDMYRAFSGEQSPLKKLTIVEAVIPSSSNFIGHRIKDLKLRRSYNCFIIGLSRKSKNITGDLALIELKEGDTLIIEGAEHDLEALFDNEQILNTAFPHPIDIDLKKAPIAILVMLGVVLFSAIGFMPIAGLAMIGAIIVILTRCVTPEQAYKTIEWRILLLIFGMLGIGLSLQNTGGAQMIVDYAIGFVDGFGPLMILAMVYILTSLLTEIITNNAVAILITPIVIAMTTTLGFDPRPFVIAIMLAASSSFATPIGYQTNTFVYAAGGYKFIDFIKIGIPMNFIMLVIAMIAIPIFFVF